MAKVNKLTKEENKATIKRILSYIKQYAWGVAASVVLAGVTVALTLYVPILTGRGVDLILGPGKVDFAGLKTVLLTIALITLVTAAAQWLMNHINNLVTYKVVKDIRTKAFNHLEVLPVSYLDSHPSGDIVSRIITDIDQFSSYLLTFVEILVFHLQHLQFP